MLEQRLALPEVWSDPNQVKLIQKQRSRLTEGVDAAVELVRLLEDAETLLELAREGEDLGDDLGLAVDKLARRAEEIELATLLTGEHDASDAIVEIHPGAGGTESQDWAGMLLRMYSRWAERSGWDVEVLDERARHLRQLAGSGRGKRGGNVLKAPMPGLVVRVEVEPGQAVVEGQGVVVLEAMKMENELRASAAATVAAVRVAPGAAVEKGDVLVEYSLAEGA